jgi:hypothetical protein
MIHARQGTSQAESRILSTRIFEHHESYFSARQQSWTAISVMHTVVRSQRGPRIAQAIPEDLRVPACCDIRHMVRVIREGSRSQLSLPHEAYKFSPERPTDYRTDKDLGLDW